MTDHVWTTRPAALVAACRSCLGSDGDRWVRRLRSSLLRQVGDTALTVGDVSCLGLCPGAGRVSVLVTLPDRPALAAVLEDTEGGHRAVLELLDAGPPDTGRSQRRGS